MLAGITDCPTGFSGTIGGYRAIILFLNENGEVVGPHEIQCFRQKKIERNGFHCGSRERLAPSARRRHVRVLPR
jgi:hypothetical protein